MNTSDLAKRAEAFLFSEGGSLTLRKLEQLLGVKTPQLREILAELRAKREGSGLTLVETATEASLVIAPEESQAVRSAFERELEKEIGDAGLEVLAIVLYRGPSTRAQIDYIRGVNTSSTMRTLLARGLLLRTGNPEDGREYLYYPTGELLAHLGVRTAEELPDYQTIKTELAAFESTNTQSIGGAEGDV